MSKTCLSTPISLVVFAHFCSPVVIHFASFNSLFAGRFSISAEYITGTVCRCTTGIQSVCRSFRIALNPCRLFVYCIPLCYVSVGDSLSCLLLMLASRFRRLCVAYRACITSTSASGIPCSRPSLLQYLMLASFTVCKPHMSGMQAYDTHCCPVTLS